MPADYRKFKTPFYEISIGDAAGKRMVKLPHHILRLVDKVEILESFQGTAQDSFTTVTLSIVEGSREPASQDASMGTKGLYKLPIEGGQTDMDIAGSMTNRTGVVTDLRFSGSSGITFLTESERKKGQISNVVEPNVDDKSVTRTLPREPKSPTFLFQAFNQVKVKWGYVEDPSTHREIITRIAIIKTSFPDNAMPRTTVVCQDTGAFLDQMATTKGIPFGRRVRTGTGNSVIDFEDIKTDELIRELCDKAGMPCIISENLPVDKLDKDHQKMWIAGESFHQFMTRLAERNNAYYKVIPNPKTGVDTLMFIKKSDFEARTIIRDKSLLTYKAPGTLLKTFNVTADFASIVRNTQLDVDETGAIGRQTTETGQDQAVQFKAPDSTKNEQFVDADPTGSNPIPACLGVKDKVLDGEFTGSAENDPDQSALNTQQSAEVVADKISRKLVTVDFSTVGYTKLTPGVVEVNGVGVRYSGKYRVLTTTHSISPSNYITKCTAHTYSLANGGVDFREGVKGQDQKPEKVQAQQFTAKRVDTSGDSVTTSSGTVVRDELDKLQGTE